MKKIFKSFLSLFLILTFLLQIIPIQAYAEATAERSVRYLEEIKIFSEKDVDNAASQGYTVLSEDLNRNTAGDQVFLGYKTTTDPAKAIYDLKLMNMNGGYKFTNIDEIFEQQEDNFSVLSNWFIALTDAYREAYSDGHEMAKNIYPVLNLFKMEESDSRSGLGKCIVDGELSSEEAVEILLLCNSTYIDTIIKLLVTGLKNNDKWLNKLSDLGPYSSSTDYVALTSYVSHGEELETAAENLHGILKQHAQIYNLMEKTGAFAEKQYDEEGNPVAEEFYSPTAEEAEILHYCMGLEGYYESAFDELEQYPYGENSNLKEFFCSLETLPNTKINQLFPLLASLDKGQYAALYFGCVPELILNSLIVPRDSAVSDDDFTDKEFNETYTSLVEEAKKEYGVELVYLYDGVDKALLSNDTTIAFTEEAERHKAVTGEMDYFGNELDRADKFTDNLRFTAFVGMVCIGTMSVAKITTGVAAIATGAKTLATLGTMAGYKGTFFSILVNIGSLPGIIVTAVTVAVVFLYFVCVYISDYIEENFPNWSDYPIPDYIYDITDTSTHAPVYNVYEAVKQNETDTPADLNTFDGKQWLVLYASYDNVDGTRKPIKADDIDDIKVSVGNGDVPEGYAPLCEFGEVVTKDLNAYDRNDTSGGVYLFYRQDNEAVTPSTKTYYVKDVYLQTGYGDTECINNLQDAGYTPINQNLTPHYIDYSSYEGRRVYTYLGYKLTTVASSAIRDLRFCYDYKAPSYTYGTISYGEHGTSGKMTLYASKMVGAGTPILASGLKVVKSNETAPAGYEPVNLFSGGPAVSINHSDCYSSTFGEGELMLYFLPEVSFTEGPDFLSGIAFFDDNTYYLANGTKPSEVGVSMSNELQKALEYWEGSDAKLEDYDSVLQILELLMPKRFGYQYMLSVSEFGKNPEYLMYSTTKNPYRAIYGVTGTAVENAGQNIVYNNVGYSSMTVYNTYTDPDGDVSVTVNSAACKNTVEGRFFVSGNLSGNTHNGVDSQGESGKIMTKQEPLLASEVFFLTDNEATAPGGYKPITDVYDGKGAAVTVKAKDNGKSIRLFLMMPEKADLPYVSTVYAVDYATLFRQYASSIPDFPSTALSRANAMAALATMGATHFCSEDLYMPDGNFTAQPSTLNGVKGVGNVVNFGYSRTDNINYALRDLAVVCVGMSAGKPEKTIYKNGYKYNLLCEIGSWNYTGLEDNYTPRIYLYGSTDKRLGEPITDFFVDKNIFVDGYETVKTNNGKDIMSDIRDQIYEGAAAYNEELWYLCKAWLKLYSGYADIFVHFRRASNTPEQQKPYVSELFTVERQQLFSREDGPFLSDGNYYDRYESIAGAVNRVNGDGYFTVDYYTQLVYKRSKNVSDAITDIVLHNVKQDTLTVNGITYLLAGKASSSSSNPVYLYYTKDTAAGAPISELKQDFDLIYPEDETKSYTYACTAGTKSYGSVYINASYDKSYLLIGRPYEAVDGTWSELKVYENPSVETRISFSGGEEGKYISGIFIMDKNTLRQEKLASGIASDKCKCSDISKDEVIARLKTMGATFVLDNCIETNGGNQIYIGITRTNLKIKALKDVVLHTELLNAEAPDEKINLNKKTYYLVAEYVENGEQPKPINLLCGADEQNSPGPAIYMYASKSAGDCLYELSLDLNPIVNGRRTVLSQNGMEAFADLAEQAKAYTKRIENSPHFLGKDYTFLWYYYTIEEYLMEYNESISEIYHPEEEGIKAWYLHTKNYETQAVEEALPYIAEIFVTYGQSKREALAELMKHKVDGFIDVDANQDAGGDYVYIGYTRCAKADEDKAIRDLVICEGKNPKLYKMIKKADTNVLAEYKLVADVDLNKSAGGDYLYLYATKDEKAGSPLTDIYISVGRGKTVDKEKDGYSHSTVLKDETDKKVDINDGAGGDYLYLIQVRDLHNEIENSFLHVLAGSLFSSPTFGIIVMSIVALSAIIIFVIIVKKKKKQS